jgi:hypothetical protein
MNPTTIVCPECRIPFRRFVGGDSDGKPSGLYYDLAKADWCAECRQGVRWFPEPQETA